MLLLSTTHEISHLIFFFNDTATTEIYTLSLHDALPILRKVSEKMGAAQSWSYGRSSKAKDGPQTLRRWYPRIDRKSTRLNSSHQIISYAVFCLKKKKKKRNVRQKHLRQHIFEQNLQV